MHTDDKEIAAKNGWDDESLQKASAKASDFDRVVRDLVEPYVFNDASGNTPIAATVLINLGVQLMLVSNLLDRKSAYEATTQMVERALDMSLKAYTPEDVAEGQIIRKQMGLDK